MNSPVLSDPGNSYNSKLISTFASCIWSNSYKNL